MTPAADETEAERLGDVVGAENPTAGAVAAQLFSYVVFSREDCLRAAPS